MSTHYDNLETRSRDAREASLFECLRSQLGAACAAAPGLARHLEGVEPGAVTDRAALAKLPVLRKSALVEMQKAEPPFGGLTTRPAAAFEHVFQSPGPIYEPGVSSVADWWRFARALYAAGFRKGEIVHNSFAYHLTPAGVMLESGARALGCAVLAGGVGNTEAQATAAADIGASGYIGTPDFLKIMIEKAEELGRELKIARAWVSGGPLFPSLRQFYTDRGIPCLQGYATADLGSIAYETPAMEGMVVDEGVIVEIVRPGTGDPVPEGEVGEVLVTALNPDYPLIRFATGDLSAVLPGISPCGRTNMRIKGWMGRADQTTKVKGMFVRPEQVAEILARHPEIAKARLSVTREADQDRMTLAIEAAEPSADLAARVRETMQAVLKLKGEVEADLPGSLPNDGKVIDDLRKFD
ncbi:phenylacetate--CoA ligase family protein [Limibaculum sp. M0105]|uniref:Phenylacetate--CoA ligase family protein n=1 Tax=Thermohalobaculum xanthum TaxID=2753746 RepID=A0A8J7M7P3_9RHOB|nr:phenylacetate--CoA ligase family protein [Thermohalobaculum xanthum]MBK0399240.1 phenylacetate--CoA ligase family protein [Thermohalobaculum xanthum]